MNHIFRACCSVSPICIYLFLCDIGWEVARYLQSFHEVLALRRWKRQLFIRRVAALWMYTEFFMITGILASSSALRMHSSKNSEEKTPLWAVMAETLQAMKQLQFALTDGLSWVTTFHTSLDHDKEQSMKIQNIIRMDRFKVTKTSTPQQIYAEIIERTATIHLPSIILQIAWDSAAKSLWYYDKTSQLFCNRGVWSFAHSTVFEGLLKPVKSNCGKGDMETHGHTHTGHGFLPSVANTSMYIYTLQSAYKS